MSEFQIKKRLTEFAYVDQNDQMHLEIDKMLQVMGLPDSPSNRAQMTEFVHDLLRKEHPSVEIVDLPDV